MRAKRSFPTAVARRWRHGDPGSTQGWETFWPFEQRHLMHSGAAARAPCYLAVCSSVSVIIHNLRMHTCKRVPGAIWVVRMGSSQRHAEWAGWVAMGTFLRRRLRGQALERRPHRQHETSRLVRRWQMTAGTKNGWA